MGRRTHALTKCTSITIGDRVYSRNPDVDRYQIPIDELGELSMREIPPHSHVEIMGLPLPDDSCEGEVFALNSGDAGEVEYLSVYGGVSFRVSRDDRSHIVARLRRGFPDREEDGIMPNPNISTQQVGDGILANVYLNLDFKAAPDTLVTDAVVPFIDGFQRLCEPYVHVFICHASEDKPIARELASAMKSLGSEVWFDE